jgi:hypothetical protein
MQSLGTRNRLCLVPTIFVGTQSGRSAFQEQQYGHRYWDAERPGGVPTQSLGTRKAEPGREEKDNTLARFGQVKSNPTPDLSAKPFKPSPTLSFSRSQGLI